MKIAAEALRRAVQAIFTAAGSDEHEASTMGTILVDANLVGHDSHGVIRVPGYIDQLLAGRVAVNRHISTVSQVGAISIVDGNMGFGQVIGGEVVDLGVAKAGEYGISLVGLRNAGHLGRIGYWAEKAAAEGVVSLHFVSAASPGGAQIAAFGGRDRRMAANPMAAGIPVGGGDPIIVDIATSEIAVGKIRVARNKGARLPYPCIIDADGNPTDDPNALFANPPGAVMTFGGHKGYALNLLFDLLAGALTGAGIHHRGARSAVQSGNNLLSIFIDPRSFIDMQSMTETILDYVAWLKESVPIKSGDQVRIPGERSRDNRTRNALQGLFVDDATWNELLLTAEKVGLTRSQIDEMGGRRKT